MDKGAYANIPTQRMFIWMTLLLGTVFGIGFAGLMKFFPPPPANLLAEQVVQIYAAHNIRLRIGVILGIIGGGFLVPLTIVTSIQMARLEKGIPIWAMMQAATGILGTLLLWLPMVIFGTAAFSVERDPALTLLFHEFGWLLLVTPVTLFPMQMIGIVILSFSKEEEDRVSAFPRWLGYLTAWQLVQAFGGPIAMLFKTGIFSWNGLIPLWLPMILFGIWIGAICFTILRALGHQERTVAGGA